MKNDQPSENGKFSGDVDPEIADLMGFDEPEEVDIPRFDDLFEESSREDLPLEETDLTVRTFRRPSVLEEEAKPFFNDKEYYKKVLSGEGDVAKRIHSYFSSFLTTQDPQERSVFRGRLIPAFWELVGNLAVKVTRDLSEPKKVFLRYSALLPTAISQEQRDLLCRIVWENSTGEPIYYIDEWLVAVARGQVTASAQDETRQTRRGDDRQKMSILIERAKGKYEAQLGLIRGRITEIEELEARLVESAGALGRHDTRQDLPGLKLPYSDGQRSSLNEINEVLRRLGLLNRDLARYYSDLDTAKSQYEDLKKKEQDLGDSAIVDNKVIIEELNTVRQMAKMCVGRQGNHFPILLKQYFRPNMYEVGTRENILNIMADVEALDSGIFLRTFKQQTNRIVPNIVLIPCFGDLGVCWEPFERFNRATGRGRLALPMFPKDLRTAVVASMADLRWQVAKEKAQHYWMEEGLTGWYYQWFSERKMKGDVREFFIQDYILWITKESEGMQKLDKDVRGIFWRYIPFPPDIKEKLKNRGFVYAELFKKDQNRAMSDGY